MHAGAIDSIAAAAAPAAAIAATAATTITAAAITAAARDLSLATIANVVGARGRNKSAISGVAILRSASPEPAGAARPPQDHTGHGKDRCGGEHGGGHGVSAPPAG
jgi:hypothetical protein